MITKRRIVLGVILGTIVTAIMMCGFHEIKDAYTTRSSTNALPSEVTFLRLPNTASQISFWRDGVNYFAEFNVSEDEFRRTFSKFTFLETSFEIIPKGFNSSNAFPYEVKERSIFATNGLWYQKRFSNGGGCTIQYDRSRSRAYYDFAKR